MQYCMYVTLIYVCQQSLTAWLVWPRPDHFSHLKQLLAIYNKIIIKQTLQIAIQTALYS